MLFDDVKLVVYVCKSRYGRWPIGSAFLNAARAVAEREGVTGALLDDGKAILHVVEGRERAVDRFMAHVAQDRRLSEIRVIHEARRTTRVFANTALGYHYDDAWRPRIAALIAGGALYRSDVREFCVVLLDGITSRERARELRQP
ncbi:MAG: hypothetical protein EOO29_17395 [Comamonadaceae bacterium]|nr:MAG: hypothetical protein EOO29_17395 [Comamonadaceae bacterium]